MKNIKICDVLNDRIRPGWSDTVWLAVVGRVDAPVDEVTFNFRALIRGQINLDNH